ncbi:hypothetical protein GCM10023113_02060 [Cellulomonas oligotrophica]|uniref:Polymerase nucleotidyl transferase domain-containing protein n=1 Tax=Cellulomonas oligotrophica TaxID=931536 RepID=A0ABQ4DAH6_9CELL|nr:hypothetical protein Col01nite_18960 [Cellulomonas oligotrophica]
MVVRHAPREPDDLEPGRGLHDAEVVEPGRDLQHADRAHSDSREYYFARVSHEVLEGAEMDVAHPLTAVLPSAHGPVLAVLASTTRPLTGRAIAELTQPHVSQSRVARILRELVDAGVVNREPAGSAALFTLNREHLAAPAVEALVSLRTLLWERIAAHVGGWTHPPTGVIVFGSTARGDGDANSDIDLLVIRPADIDDGDEHWQADLTDLAASVTRWTGNPCEIVDRSTSDLRTMSADGERLLAEIRRDGRAVVGSVALVPAPEAA